jgi:hypothetical protein
MSSMLYACDQPPSRLLQPYKRLAVVHVVQVTCAAALAVTGQHSCSCRSASWQPASLDMQRTQAKCCLYGCFGTANLLSHIQIPLNMCTCSLAALSLRAVQRVQSAQEADMFHSCRPVDQLWSFGSSWPDHDQLHQLRRVCMPRPLASGLQRRFYQLSSGARPT